MTNGWSLPINIAELRGLVEGVLAHIEEFNGPVVDLPTDMFWAMHAPAMYEIEPSLDEGQSDLKHPELTIGSLADTWEFLHSEGDPVSYSAVWLSQILTAVGYAAKG